MEQYIPSSTTQSICYFLFLNNILYNLFNLRYPTSFFHF